MKRISQSKAAQDNPPKLQRRSRYCRHHGGDGAIQIVRAQGATLKVGVLLPKSGYQAGIGQDCQRGVDIAAGILKDLGLPPLQDHERRYRNQC